MSKSKAESITWGGFVEKVVCEYLNTCDLEDVKKTPAEVDMKEHIDYTFLSKKLQRYVGIDVKAPTVVKGFEENDVNYATFVNNYGEPGWLYGKSDFAFLVTFDEFVIVELSELRTFLEEKTNGQVPVNGNPKRLYTKFHCSFNGGYRKSVSTLFKIDDVKKLPSARVIKHKMGDTLREAFKKINKNI